jgi:hypothetical protein
MGQPLALMRLPGHAKDLAAVRDLLASIRALH